MNNGPVSRKRAVKDSLDNQIRKKMKLRVNEQGPSWPLLPKATSTKPSFIYFNNMDRP